MLKKRLYILAGVLLVGYSGVWFLPKAGEMKLSRLARHLPMEFESFRGQRVEVTGEEYNILAKDTEFERIKYADISSVNQPFIEVSVVFSGKDINNSIHRPERCLRSQGWNFVKERTIVIKNILADGSDMPFREIVCETTRKREDGVQIKTQRVQYYTFFGHSTITESHYGRTWADMKDRVLKGHDQQWAYATFSMPVTEVYAQQGLMDPSRAHTLEESEKMLQSFVKKMIPLVVDQ
ncbi:MAG: exosortase-associated EpsI family protein [Akkermansiaceae bacterium]